jgi:TonB-dependent receptor
MKTSPTRRLVLSAATLARLTLAALSLCIINCPLFISRAAAQTAAQAQTVTITGRVSDAVANAYLNNAEIRVAGTNIMALSRDDGTYSIDAPVSPSGSVTITVNYANNRPETRTIEISPGGPNVLDFVLQPAITVPLTAADMDIIQLERFTVTDERIGQAKMLMEQRAADNIKTIISTDHFGELTQGSVGEFMKYMPGITLDTDDEGELSFVRVGGLDPKYAGFSMDGITLASANEGMNRANHFNQMSITAIESIEFNQTLLARMPANTPAGKFELKTRYAFNRKRPEISFDLGFDGTGNTIELGRSYMPDNKKHMRTYLGGRVGYGGAFFKRRLGIEASVSRYQNYRNDQRHEIQYSYLVPGAKENEGITFVERNGRLEALEGPTIQRLNWLDGPRIRTSQAASLSVDYKITPNLIFAVRSNYTFNENEYFNVHYSLLAQNQDGDFTTNANAPTPSADPSSTLTRWVVNPTGPGNTPSTETALTETADFRITRSTNYLVSPRLNYKKGNLEIDFKSAYSYSQSEFRDGENGRFRTAANRLGGLGWIAERSSTDSPTWHITQNAGTLWTEPQNISRVANYSMGIYNDDPHSIKNEQISGSLDFTYAASIFGHPVTLRAGGSYLESDYTRRYSRKNYILIGKEGLQLASTYPFADNYIFTMDLGGKAGNINEQSWPVIDQDTLWAWHEEHPEWFIENTTGNLRNAFVGRNDLTERIEAVYAEATTRAGRFSFNLGVRAERTEVDVLFTRMLSEQEIEVAKHFGTPEQIATGMFDNTTYEGSLFQYKYGVREERSNNYDNLFLSGGLKYDFTQNLRFQLSASQAILRPDYGNLSGTVNYPTYYPTSLWIPNGKLKPEKTTKFYVGLQYYLTPSGIIELSVYRLDILDMQIPNMQINEAQAENQLGYSLNDALKSVMEEVGEEYDEEEVQEYVHKNMRPIVYRSTINASGGARVVYGYTVRYDQQLTFLPGILKGLSLFGSFTTATLKNAEMDEEKIGRASKSANGGIRYRLGRFNVRLSGVWNDDALKSITRPVEADPGDPPYTSRRWVLDDYQYQKARFTVDLSGGFRLNKNLELVFSIRNLTQEPIIYYSKVPGRLSRYSVPDTIWNFSIRGKY